MKWFRKSGLLHIIVRNNTYLDKIDDLDDELKIVLMEMLDEKPENRPELSELIKLL